MVHILGSVVHTHNNKARPHQLFAEWLTEGVMEVASKVSFHAHPQDLAKAGTLWQ